MAISARLGRCYRRCFRLRLIALPLGREQSIQRRERAVRRHRMRLHAHRAAARSIKHPKRQLPNAYGRRPRQAASRRGNRPTLRYLMNANGAPGPGMPRVDDLDLVTNFRTVCLLVRSCTIPSAAIRRSTSSAHSSSKGGQRLHTTMDWIVARDLCNVLLFAPKPVLENDILATRSAFMAGDLVSLRGNPR
jgi:hypothetical protein